ncbi:uncharacterized protein UDID_18674 [Ustilago sp. UG-2017a]|nr:uncharacterized protein UDID_18674 [Ustilago sp. UG-2017a]
MTKQRLYILDTRFGSTVATPSRAQMINTFLLSKLWHTIHLCPIPCTLQCRLNSILNPFLFLGRRNWICHAYVVSSRHLGGLGVIDTDAMSFALIGQMAANLLQSKELIGAQFRAVLQEYLWSEYKALPAHFILRRGMPWLAMINTPTSQ